MVKGRCTYCGKHRRLTADHIPAKCFFPKPRPSNLITVKVCQDCHDPTGADDEYMRNMLVLSNFAADHSYFDDLSSAALRAIADPDFDGQRNDLRRTLRFYDLGEEGVLLSPVFDPELERIHRTVERYALGLHRWRYGEIMAPHCRARTFPLFIRPEDYRPGPRTLVRKVVPILINESMEVRGDDAFRFASVRVAGTGSLWLLGIFEAWWLVALAREQAAAHEALGVPV